MLDYKRGEGYEIGKNTITYENYPFYYLSNEFFTQPLQRQIWQKKSTIRTFMMPCTP